jgi:hypothetical protein
MFREACEYADGSRVMVETTLEVHGGKIVRQVEVVSKDTGLTHIELRDQGGLKDV